MRRTDPMSQRRLLELLRADIEKAMNGNTRARSRAIRLAWDNPHSVHSTHVAYNLGRMKYRWLLREAGSVGHAPDAAASMQSPLVGSLGRSQTEIRSWLD